MSTIHANMAGMVLTILVSVGDEVQAGQDVVMLESMKMEVPIQAEQSGKITEIKVGLGDFVEDGQTIIELE